MAMNDSYEYKSNSEILETYDTYLTNQSPISSYPTELFPIRKQIVEWIIFLCQNLSFKNETLFKAIHLYDTYVSKCPSNLTSMNQIKLLAVACLSIATKTEELNCNFIPFFTQNVINEDGNAVFTERDLALKEIDVLKALNFRTNKSNVYHFNSVFLQLCFNSLGESYEFNWLINVNDQIMKQMIKEDYSVFNSPVQSAYYAIAETIRMISARGVMSKSKRIDEINGNIHYVVYRRNRCYNDDCSPSRNRSLGEDAETGFVDMI